MEIIPKSIDNSNELRLIKLKNWKHKVKITNIGAVQQDFIRLRPF